MDSKYFLGIYNYVIIFKPAVTRGGYSLLRNNYPIPHVSWLRGDPLKSPTTLT